LFYSLFLPCSSSFFSILKTLSPSIVHSQLLFLSFPTASLTLHYNLSLSLSSFSMDEDDEFGDLYTDVLQPFSNSSSTLPSSTPPPPPLPLLQLEQQHHPTKLSTLSPPPQSFSIDLNNDDDEILYGASSRDQTLANSAPNNLIPDGKLSLGENKGLEPATAPTARSVDFQSGEPDNDMNFDIEEANGGDMIPGLGGVDVDDTSRDATVAPGIGMEEWEEEDSDSEDDLQIVLNDASHGPMGMERGSMMGEDDDEDGEPLVIVADGDPIQAMEEPDWGGGDESAAAAGGEGEKKEGGEAGAGKGNSVVATKMGYPPNHGYHHPFHSQFKYVRPGAAPMPGSTIGPPGAPGQVRPPVNLVSMPGRGRGDWRPMGNKNGPPMQKGFPGYGMSGRGNGMGGRGFGGGLEFTLPSHKTIFEVDIDNFEEKPWKYPGVDITDFFNFGLNEESWKDYCRQLEQHRLETTMQSKIRVYESGRAEQEFDPDLPPELAAATGGHDVSADNSSIGKSDFGQSDSAKGSARARPPIIPLQRSPEDDSTTENDIGDGETDDLTNSDIRSSRVPEDEVTPPNAEYYDGRSQNYPIRKDGRKAQYVDKDLVGDRPPASYHEIPSRYRSSSRGQAPVNPSSDLGASHEESRRRIRMNDGSPHMTPSRSVQDARTSSNAEEGSVESMDGRRSHQHLSSPVKDGNDARESSVNDKDNVDEGLKDGVNKDEGAQNDIVKDGDAYRAKKKPKASSSMDLPLREVDDGEDSKAARSSENSKARSGSSRDYQKWQDGIDDEVVQGGRSTRSGSLKRHPDDNEHNSRRKDIDSRQEGERSRMISKGREGSYNRRDLDPRVAHHLQLKSEGYDRRKDHENADGLWQRRDEDPYSRKTRIEETKRRENGDEVGSRHRKVRESERNNKDDLLHPRKQLDNGSYRVHYEKDSNSKQREREDSVKHRYEIVDDYHSKRRKDEEYIRREFADKDEMLQSHRESSSRRRGRDDVIDLRKRDDQQRTRDSLDDYHSGRHKDEVWLSRERSDRPREREELYRPKQSHEEHLSKRERDEGRGSVRSGRGTDEKAWIGNTRGKEEFKGTDKEYQVKDSVRPSEQLKKRDRIDDVRGNQVAGKERRSRQDKPSSRTDRAVDTPDNQRSQDKKHKESTRKLKEPESADLSTLGSSMKSREDKAGQSENLEVKDSSKQRNDGNQNAVQQRNSSKRAKEDAFSDEDQHDSKKGRSKFERWSSQKEREFNVNNKSAPSAKLKNGDKNDNGGSSEASRQVVDEPPKRIQSAETDSIVEEKDVVDTAENKDADKKQLDDRHLDTVEKLKKRSERFKLPLAIEKDVSNTKKTDTEALPPVNKTEPAADSEVKPERPARRRRWVGN
ncbi:FIP1[V]-like protein, partial [Linum perenne]